LNGALDGAAARRIHMAESNETASDEVNLHRPLDGLFKVDFFRILTACNHDEDATLAVLTMTRCVFSALAERLESSITRDPGDPILTAFYSLAREFVDEVHRKGWFDQGSKAA
jgi:hypothetical protein